MLILPLTNARVPKSPATVAGPSQSGSFALRPVLYIIVAFMSLNYTAYGTAIYIKYLAISNC